jgi:hypothetical protein
MQRVECRGVPPLLERTVKHSVDLLTNLSPERSVDVGSSEVSNPGHPGGWGTWGRWSGVGRTGHLPARLTRQTRRLQRSFRLAGWQFRVTATPGRGVMLPTAGDLFEPCRFVI